MVRNRRLETDDDMREAMDRQSAVRVFKDDLVVGSGGVISRFDDATVVVQSGVSDIQYYERSRCEFFEMSRR